MLSERYFEAIKALENAYIKEFDKIDTKGVGFWLSPYDRAVEQIPELADITSRVEQEIKYQVSYNQCCAALVMCNNYDKQ